MERLIVSRHPAAIEFIRRHSGFEAAPVIEEATADDVRGKYVAGNLPFWLAVQCGEVYAIEFDSGQAPRGTELSLEAMEAAGARLAGYRVEYSFHCPERAAIREARGTE